MLELQKKSGNIKDMVSMFERSVLPHFHAVHDTAGRIPFEAFVGVGPRIEGPDLARKKMLDVLNAIQFMELDDKIGVSDDLHVVTSSYALFGLVERRLDDIMKLDLRCVGGEATARLLIRECRGEFRRLQRATFFLNAAAKALLWVQKKAAAHRAARRWPVRPGI